MPKDGWIEAELSGTSLIDGFILPMKVPLHDNYTRQVEREGGKIWRLKEVLELEQKFERKIGMIVDLADTKRYYDPSELEGIEYLKMPINHNRKNGLPMDRIQKCVSKIKYFRDSCDEVEPKMVLIHW